MPDITFFIHLYYPGSWNMIREKCAPIMQQAAQIIITACYDEVIEEIGPTDANTTVLKVTNKGKDIGGKLAGLSYYLHFCKRTEYFAFLHDKTSPQTINAEYWRDSLFSIFEKNSFDKAMRMLEEDPQTGILGSKAFIRNEFVPESAKFDTTNNDVLWELISNYQLNGQPYDFVAGTVFIGRSRILETFFSAHSPLDAREELEKGNVLDLEKGTYTHAWERLFCFIAEDQGYKITGI
ncbi:MAG TPA: rhamnan synthesis F family protein [Puia sp.]|jgi:lipopolysaccharide biosynthesis protein|nr:rhamnan synthesis F family protein [Puia sp.]